MKRIGLVIIHTRGQPLTCEEYPCVHLAHGDATETPPRMRGEQVRQLARDFSRGSPPHMRGTQYIVDPYTVDERITPAYAGNTPTTISRGPSSQDHPRICRGAQSSPAQKFSGEGSPPHTRGALLGVLLFMPILKIIPAYAGNTARPAGESGEVGSPPRMLGTLERVPRLPYTRRIIPTYAGSTLCRWWPTCSTRGHPLVCGEHSVLSSVVVRW